MTSQDKTNLDNQGQSPFPKGNRETDYTDTTNYFAQSQQFPQGEVDHIDSPGDFDMDDQKREEEFAAEAIGANDLGRPIDRDEQETNMQEGDVEAGWGWAAVILSLLSFFIWPLVMGIAGIVVGVMAKRRGADTLGNIAIVAGIAAIAINILLAPFV